ncbi:MAG: potassium channel family protein [Candidatus Korobacteraceae bacterium]
MPAPASTPSKKTAVAPRKSAHHYTALLLTELALILGYPFFVGTARQAGLFRLGAVLVFAAALYAFLGRGRLTVVAFVLGVPSVFIHVANVLGYLQRLEMLAVALGLVFLAFVTSVFIIGIVTLPTVTMDTLAGAVSAYLLVGITYGLAYGLVEQLHPGSFRDTVEPGHVISSSEFIFFSFVTLTTVGYGDIVPWGPHARALAIIEGVTGIMYPAVLIGRLVGLRASRSENS